MKKYLFGTMALSAMMVGCSQEELVPQVNEEIKVQDVNSVVGHDLVGPITIKVGAETRAANGAWQTSDKLGLAWFDIEGDITALQTSAKWTDFANGTIGAVDDNIYGNHLFSVVNGAFTTQTNVYQGAHFVYFPFAYAAEIAQKSVKLNETKLAASKDGEQTDFDYDRFNNVFHISTADYISASEVSADMQLTKEFTLSPVANVLKINTTPTGKFEEKDVLKALKVKSYSIETATAALADEFDVVTQNVPAAKYKKVDNVWVLDNAENTKALDAYAKDIIATPKAALTRQISANYTMAAALELPIYALPVASYTADNDGVVITVNIETASGLTGYFTINNPDGLLDNDAKVTNNMKTINKLDKAMAADGYLTKILRNNGDWSMLNLPVELSEANFTLNANITSYAQWVDAVEIYEALGVATATLTVTGDVKFETTIPTLTNGKIIAETTGNGKINITGNVTLPAESKLDLTTNEPVVEVATTGNLTIADGVKLANDNVENKGIINLGYKSQLGVRGTGVNNAAGRVNVVYGSYAYLASSKEGVVAYIVPAAYEIYKLSYLIKASNTTGEASVNTFVVGYDGNQQVTLNLNGLNAGQDDPYNPGGNTNMPALDGITIEMAGGILTKGTGAKTNVKAVKVLSGANTITEVTVLNNIEVAAGATANITGGAAKANITNKGTLALMDVVISQSNNTAIVNNGTMTVNATKVLVGGVLTATYTASAASLENTANFTVNDGVKTFTITSIENSETGIITADNKNQVKFSNMQNNGTLVRVTQ